MLSIKTNKSFPSLIICLLFVSLPLFGEKGKITNGDHLKWSEIPAIPPSGESQVTAGLKGAFAGVHNEFYIIAGGIRSEKLKDEEKNVWSDDIHILEKTDDGEYQWNDRNTIKMSRPLAHGVSISTKEGIICIGGSDDTECYADVILLSWNSVEQRIKIETLPSLPRPLAFMSGAKIGTSIYLAGGQESIEAARATHNFMVLDLADKRKDIFQWRELSPWPGPARVDPVAVEQSDGVTDAFYLFGGRSLAPGLEDNALNDAYHYDPEKSEWKSISNIKSDHSLSGASGIPYGANHMLFLRGGEQPVLAYHTITDTWIELSSLPTLGEIGANVVPWENAYLLPVTTFQPGKTTLEFWRVERQVFRKFGWLNYIVLILFFVVLIVMGWFFSKREKSTDDFFKAGKRVPWWAAGISIIGTGLSALTFMAVPAKAYATDWIYYFSYLFGPLMAPVIVYAFLPFFRRLNITTAYEYLELRFNLPVRLISSVTFIFFQIGRVSVILLLPSIALSVATGINIFLSITVLGIISTVYTVMGGIEAVVWTDVIQVLILFLGTIVSLIIMVFHMDGDISGMVTTAMENNKLHLVDFSLDPTIVTFWAVIISVPAGVQTVTDQATIQRYLTTKDERDAAKSIWMTQLIGPFSGLLFFTIGTALYLFYKSFPTKLTPGLEQTDAIFPLFIVAEMPAGISGLIIAAIFAAAMSSLDSSIHSSSTAIVTDFYRRFNKDVTDDKCLRLARWLTALFGIFGTSLSLYMGQFDIKSLWDIFIEISNLLTGGLAGIFVLAVFTKRAHATGVLVGFFASAVILYMFKNHTLWHFWWYTITGMCSCIMVGYLTSLIIPSKEKPLDGLTIYNMSKRVD